MVLGEFSVKIGMKPFYRGIIPFLMVFYITERITAETIRMRYECQVVIKGSIRPIFIRTLTKLDDKGIAFKYADISESHFYREEFTSEKRKY